MARGARSRRRLRKQVALGRSPWHLIPRSAVEVAASFLLVHAAPLLEEERYPGPAALLANLDDPRPLHRTRACSRLAADDHPVDPFKVEATERTEQRLERQKLHLGAGTPKVVDPVGVLFALDAHA